MTRDPAEVLRAAGLKRTPARIRILAAIEELSVPVSHAQLVGRPEVAELDPITVYRTLSALESAGLLHRVHGIDGTWRYCAQPHDRPGCPGNHPHFLCTSCGAMTCLLDQAMPKVGVPAGAVVEGRHLLAWGRCPTCASETP
ncbi:MAG: transcriptional repressor [Myxococcota bacterium]